jgi:hypothetical protein
MALTPVNISSYTAFKNAIMGNGYDVDEVNGYQCVDLAKLLAGNAGRAYPYWKSEPDGYAYEGWTNTSSREYNKGNLFTLVYNKSDVKTGDLVVLNNTSSNPYGHIAFADSDWDSSTTSAYLVGQNQENPSPTQGHVTTRTLVNVTTFLGAFRFIAWQEPTPPTPSRGGARGRRGFKWVLYANKLRNKY